MGRARMTRARNLNLTTTRSRHSFSESIGLQVTTETSKEPSALHGTENSLTRAQTTQGVARWCLATYPTELRVFWPRRQQTRGQTQGKRRARREEQEESGQHDLGHRAIEVHTDCHRRTACVDTKSGTSETRERTPAVLKSTCGVTCHNDRSSARQSSGWSPCGECPLFETNPWAQHSHSAAGTATCTSNVCARAVPPLRWRVARSGLKN